MKANTLLFIAISFILFLLPACNQTEKEVRILKLGHGLPTTHSVHLGLTHLNKRLQEISGGKMKLDIYPSAQLGSENQCIELLQIGSLDITKVSSAALEGFVNEVKVFGIPYLIESKEHCYTILDGVIGQQILDAMDPYWIKGLTYFDAGARSFYTINRPIHTPKDLEGLKIRVQKGPIGVEMMKTFGGSATPVDWGELYTALQSNVVDGAENNTPSITTAYHHEVIRHFSVNEHTMCPDIIIVSLHTWNKLSNQEKAWLQQAAEEAKVYQRALWAEQEKTSLDEMEQKGVQIIYPDKQPFIELATPMIHKFRNDLLYQDLIDQIRACR